MPEPQYVKHLLPRHLEIMRRLVLGQKHRDIARDMGLNESRLSLVINSPLFQLELKRLQSKRADKIFDIQERLVDAATKAVTLHDQIIDNEELPLNIRQRSGTDILNIVGRITKSTLPLQGEGDDPAPYEKRLKEVIYRETVERRGGSEEDEEDYDEEVGPDLLPDVDGILLPSDGEKNGGNGSH